MIEKVKGPQVLKPGYSIYKKQISLLLFESKSNAPVSVMKIILCCATLCLDCINNSDRNVALALMQNDRSD